MQLANWIGTTPIHALDPFMPDWAGTWFSLFPNVETVVAQVAAAILVIGSYFFSKRWLRPQSAAAGQEA
jgi:high-affinity iron transporter